MGRELFGIAALLIGVAFAALLIGHAQGTSIVVGSVTQGFGNLLNDVTLAGGYAGSSGIPSPYYNFAG